MIKIKSLKNEGWDRGVDTLGLSVHLLCLKMNSESSSGIGWWEE